MKHPLYSVSIDDIPFGDRIIAILLRTYLVRCKDAEQKLAPVISEGVVLKLPTAVTNQDAIPLKTVLEGEHLVKLIIQILIQTAFSHLPRKCWIISQASRFC